MNPDNPIHVCIVEDDPDVRHSLTQLIHGTPGFQCLGSYADAESALESLARLQPEVALVDIKLPGISGIDCVARLKVVSPEIQALMITVVADGQAIFEALQAGASGYLLKGTPPAQIIEAIRDVHGGGSPMSSQIARKVVQYFQQQDVAVRDAENLSERERQVLELMAGGDRDKEIAATLGVALPTVRTHVRHIYEKLHVRSRAEAVAKHLRR